MAPSTLRSATSRARWLARAVERLTKLTQAMARIRMATIAKVATVRRSLPGRIAMPCASPRWTSRTWHQREVHDVGPRVGAAVGLRSLRDDALLPGRQRGVDRRRVGAGPQLHIMVLAHRAPAAMIPRAAGRSSAGSKRNSAPNAQVAVARQVADDAGDDEILARVAAADGEGAADRVERAELADRLALGQHHRSGVGAARLRAEPRTKGSRKMSKKAGSTVSAST